MSGLFNRLPVYIMNKLPEALIHKFKEHTFAEIP
jgi:hypothetical protein